MRHDDRGSSSLELALLTPILLVCTLLVAYGFRVTQTAGDMQDVASETATELARYKDSSFGPSASTVASRIASEAELPCIGGISAVPSVTSVAGADARVLTVNLTCQIPHGKLGLPLTSAQTFRAQGVAAIDVFRGGSAP